VSQDASGAEAKAEAEAPAAETKELSKAERKALFEAQNKAKIEAAKAAKEKEKLSKAERAAIQEAQRAQKAGGGAPAGATPAAPAPPAAGTGGEPGKGSAGARLQHDDAKAMAKAKKSATLVRTEVVSAKKVPWFSHLPQYERETSMSQQLAKSKRQTVRQDNDIHPAVLTLGLKFADWLIVGGNARTTHLLQALCQVIMDHQSPDMNTSADLSRLLDARLKPLISYIVACRPLSIGMGNAIRWLKSKIAHVPPNLSVSEGKEYLQDHIHTYLDEKIVFADRIIAKNAAAKIADKDVVLVYGRSTAVEAGLLRAHQEGTSVRVIIVDSRPRLEGKKMLDSLSRAGISCSYIMLNSLSYVMKEVSKVLLGASAMLANGNVISRVGTSMVALMARQYNVPVLVCCETYKFSEKVHLDSICNNELADPDELVSSDQTMSALDHRCCPLDRSLADWRDVKDMKLLNLVYDLTPADLIVLVVTELGYLPPSSVPVVIREYRKEVTL